MCCLFPKLINSDHTAIGPFATMVARGDSQIELDDEVDGRQFTQSTREEKMKLIVTVVALLTALSVVPAWALFETDKQLSDKARVSMSDALKTAESAVPGKPVEVNMGKDDGKVVYKIEIIDTAKKTRHVYVDAESGKVHTVK